MDNPKVKKGDEIIVTVSRNGALEGKILTVITKSTSMLTAREPDSNLTYNIYLTGSPIDKFILADRETRKKYLKEKINETKRELIAMERDLDILENFDSEEAYVAHKISEILKEKNDPKAIERVLKELKKTNYL